MKVAFLLVFCCFFVDKKSSGATYYFSSTKGDDSRTATAAQNPLTPWKSLNKLNAFFVNLLAGDSVMLKSGDTFFGSILIAKSGSSNKNIYIGSYGNGKATITGFKTVTSWTAIGTGLIYQSSTHAANVVAINGTLFGMGRFPNEIDSNSGYLTYQSHVGQTSITSNQIANITSFVGGEVVIRPQRDILDRCLITKQTATTITYSKVSSFVPQDGCGFFFQNHINCLNRFGEWFYDKSKKQMDIFFGAFSPSNYKIQIGTTDTLIRAQSRQFITIDNISFQGANVVAIYLLGGNNFTITNCDFTLCQNGIISNSLERSLIDNCSFTYLNNDAIDLNSQDNFTYNIVSDCIVNHIGLHAGMGDSGSGHYEGIVVQGGYCTVINNRVDSTGYDAIHFSIGDSSVVQNNYVTNFCLVKCDGGGIYTWNDKRDASGSSNATTYHGNKIIGNIVMDAGAPDDGTIWGELKGVYGVQGIYCDGNSEDFWVVGNTVSNCGKGIFLHDNRNMVVTNNTSYNNKEEQLEALYDQNGLALKPVRGLVIKNNIFYSANPDQNIIHCGTLLNDVGSFGQFDSNYYGQSFADKNLIKADWVANGTKYSQVYNLSGWQQAYQYDLSTQMTSKYIPEYTNHGLIGSNKYPYGAFDSNKLVGIICIGNGCVSTLYHGQYSLSYNQTSGASANVVVQNVGLVSSTNKYILNYSLTGTKNGGTVGVYLRNHVDYKPLIAAIQYFTYGTLQQNSQIYFSPTRDDTAGQIIFQFNSRDSTIYLDNISLYEALISPTDPYQFLNFVINPSSQSTHLQLTSTYWSADNKQYNNSVLVLPPYSSVVLINLANGTKQY